MPDELLSVAQAATRLRCSAALVTLMCRDGRLAAEKIGRDWVIRAADLEGIAVVPPGRPKKEKKPCGP